MFTNTHTHLLSVVMNIHDLWSPYVRVTLPAANGLSWGGGVMSSGQVINLGQPRLTCYKLTPVQTPLACSMLALELW